RIELAHGVKHAGIVEPVGARLYEDEARKANAARELEIGRQRLVGRRVAQVRAVGVAIGRAEDVEVRVAGLRRRRIGRLEAVVGIVCWHCLLLPARAVYPGTAIGESAIATAIGGEEPWHRAYCLQRRYRGWRQRLNGARREAISVKVSGGLRLAPKRWRGPGTLVCGS